MLFFCTPTSSLPRHAPFPLSTEHGSSEHLPTPWSDMAVQPHWLPFLHCIKLVSWSLPGSAYCCPASLSIASYPPTLLAMAASTYPLPPIVCLCAFLPAASYAWHTCLSWPGFPSPHLDPLGRPASAVPTRYQLAPSHVSPGQLLSVERGAKRDTQLVWRRGRMS